MIKSIFGFIGVFYSSLVLVSAPIKIVNVTYTPGDQMMEIDIFYSCGFKEHVFDIKWGPIKLDYPKLVTATVRHVEGADDHGEMGCFKKLNNNISAIDKPITITVVNEDLSSSKRIYIPE